MRTFEIDLSKLTTPPAVRDHLNDGGDASRNDNRFLGLPLYEDRAVAIATIVRQGDAATTSRVADAVKQCAGVKLPSARTIKPMWADRRLTGTRIDLDAALAGQPRAWGRFERTRVAQGTRTIAIYIPTGGPGYLSAEQIAWAPVPALVVADLLEAAGYRCEIWTASRADRTEICSGRALLKRSEDTLDLNSVARCAHAAFHRGIVMPARRRACFPKSTDTGRYGQTISIDPSDFGDSDAIAVKHTYSLADAVSEVKRIIETFEERS